MQPNQSIRRASGSVRCSPMPAELYENSTGGPNLTESGYWPLWVGSWEVCQQIQRRTTQNGGKLEANWYYPRSEWVRPDLNRSRQHPKLVGFLVSREDPRAQTKLPHGPAAPSKDCGRKNASPAAHPNGSTSSMSSAWDRIIRRQQYRFRPSSSRTFLGSSPWRVRSTKLGKALPTTLPQVKHRTGMIMPSPIRLLSFLPRAPAERFLRQLPSRVGDDQRPVVFAEERFEFVVVQVLDEPAGDRRAHRVRLAHDASTLDLHIDIDRVNFPPGELQRLEDLQAAEFERVDLNRDAVDPDHAPPFRQGRAGHGGLPLPARHDRLHGEPSNLDPNSLE